MKLKLEKLSAKELMDTGSMFDKQDVQLTIKVGPLTFKTERVRDAGVECSFNKNFEMDISEADYNGGLEIEVEVLNVNGFGQAKARIGAGNATIKSLIPKLHSRITFEIPLIFSGKRKLQLQGIVIMEGIIVGIEATSGSAVNDSARGGIDRFGFTSYARALTTALNAAAPPLCVGLYARWGSGKSFLFYLLKKNFDDSVYEVPRTHELLQWYDVGYVPLTDRQLTTPKDMQPKLMQAAFNRFMLVLYCCLPRTEFFVDPVSQLPYILATAVTVMYDTCRDCTAWIVLWLSAFYYGHGYDVLDSDDVEVGIDESQNMLLGTGAKEVVKEYVFVDFNAWEFSSSDYIWAGLIRNLYNKVEQRMKQHKRSSFLLRRHHKSTDPDEDLTQNVSKPESFLWSRWKNFADYFHLGRTMCCCYRSATPQTHPESRSDPDASTDESTGRSRVKKTDYKMRWRVQKGIRQLEQRYGGRTVLRLGFVLLTLFVLSIIVLATVIGMNHQAFLSVVRSSAATVTATVVTVTALIAGTVPAARLLFFTKQDVGTSRGDTIFNEANNVRDTVGFMNHVREELDELFRFMVDDFQAETGIKLILVLLVDDLDRCLEGRNVRVLEAIQLLLAIPGAPVLVFLAIDARIVVASIEASFSKSMSTEALCLSGWEYLDKIVQLPFCVPEAPPEKVERLVTACIINHHDMIRHCVATIEECILQLLNMVASAHFVRVELPAMHGNAGADSTTHTIKDVPMQEVEAEEFIRCLRYGQLPTVLPSMGERIEDVKSLLRAAAVLSVETRTAYEAYFSGVPEAKELLCASILDALRRVVLIRSKKSSDLDTSSPPGRDDVGLAQDRKKDSSRDSDIEKGNALIGDRISDEDPDASLLAVRTKFEMSDAASHSPLLPSAMSSAAALLCTKVDPNPRKLKRIINVLKIVHEVSRIKPVSERHPELKLHTLPHWNNFSKKVTKWIFLAENYPYRVSFLVHVLYDFEQKGTFNRVAKTARSAKLDKDARNSPNHGENIFQYRRYFEKNGEASGIVSYDTDTMEILQFYILHVERYLYNIRSVHQLMRLDGDPEEFLLLLQMPLRGEDVPTDSVDSNLPLTCEDVLGPLDETTYQRDRNFSLLQHSYNLNPALRRQISFEMSEIVAEHELYDATNSAEAKAAIQRGTVQRKDAVLSFNIAEELCEFSHQK